MPFLCFFRCVGSDVRSIHEFDVEPRNVWSRRRRRSMRRSSEWSGVGNGYVVCETRRHTSDGETTTGCKATGGGIARGYSPMDECPEDISCAILFMDHKSAVLMYDSQFARIRSEIDDGVIERTRIGFSTLLFLRLRRLRSDGHA